MRVRRCLPALLAALLAACGGAGGSVGQAGPFPTPFVRFIYASNAAGNEVLLMRGTAGGNVAPAQILSGSATQLDNPSGLALGPSGVLYVANRPLSGNGAITVYPSFTGGNIRPTFYLRGNLTQLTDPSMLALDSSGTVYATNPGSNSIVAFASNLSVNVYPSLWIAGTATNLSQPNGIAIGPNGNIFVANTGNNSITVYLPVSTTTTPANEAPILTISGSNTGLNAPFGLAIDSFGRLYVGNRGNNTVEVFAQTNVSGNVAPLFTLAGPSTHLDHPAELWFDSSFQLDVANLDAGSGSVAVFSPLPFPLPGNGNIAPVLLISGASTHLTTPVGVAAP